MTPTQNKKEVLESIPAKINTTTINNQ